MDKELRECATYHTETLGYDRIHLAVSRWRGRRRARLKQLGSDILDAR